MAGLESYRWYLAYTIWRRGADVNLAVPLHRWTSLRQAARDGNPKIIKSLVKAGAHLDAKDRNGWTPIVTAAMAGSKAAFQLSRGIPLKWRW